ncbi:MAG: hypothetical protein LN588_00225 [Rickettsia endosymbiont of Bryobia graminum]|nr:hypothetical protein [Rickettsia endosymbiont of Bryobia graminum]
MSYLVFQDNQNNKHSAWGRNTSIDTTLSAAKILGSIDVKTPIDIAGRSSIKVVVNEAPGVVLPAVDAPEEYEFINSNGGNIDLNRIKLARNQAYTGWSAKT